MCELQTGSVLNVLEIEGLEARIDSPVKGWVSWRLRNGYVILERVKMVDSEHLEPVGGIGVSRSDCEKFTRFLAENSYDSETVLDDLIDAEDDPFNEFKDSNLFPRLKNNKFLAKIVKKHLGGTRNDDDELPPFSFGENQWMYWPYYKEYDVFNVAKHSNLKTECLNNAIHSMTLDRFTAMLAKAVLLKQSKKGRSIKAMNNGGLNQEFEIPVNLPLTVSHIVVLLMYCNDTKLQYKYKKFGTRKTSREQSFEEFKALNAEIGIWYRLLSEVIDFFGTQCSPSNVLFTGLNVRLSFASFAPIFQAPFSTTTSIDVANRFCDGAGIILKLIPSVGAMDKFFDVQWLSDFEHEKERLFFKAYDLGIADIGYVERGQFTKNGRYLRAFTLFSKLFDGHYFMGQTKGQRKAEKMLLNLISMFCASNGIGVDWGVNSQSVPISLYMQQLFFNLMESFKSVEEHFVILSEFDKLSDALKLKLFQFERDESNDEQLTVSPFLGSLCGAKSIHFVQEYIWLIHDEQLRQLQNGAAGYCLFSFEEYHYELDEGERISFVFRVDRKVCGSNKAAFGLRITNCPDGMCKAGKLSVIVDEVDWCYNGWNMAWMKKGSYSGMWAFPDEFVEKVESLTIRVAVRFLE